MSTIIIVQEGKEKRIWRNLIVKMHVINGSLVETKMLQGHENHHITILICCLLYRAAMLLEGLMAKIYRPFLPKRRKGDGGKRMR